MNNVQQISGVTTNSISNCMMKLGKIFGRVKQKGNCFFSCFWISALMCGLSAPVYSVDAESVFKNTGPSVVLIKDLEGFGSGVVLTSDGLIVTCHHVVNTPLKLIVVAEVNKMGQRVKQEFKDVKVVGVHPVYDLALLQVKVPAGVTFIVPPKSTGRPISTGEDCYVIGNPSGAGGKVLECSISKGIIGAAERTVDSANYIQVTAPINPGNSGGALCDKNGQLIGIVTFKIGESEGLGFAIPIAKAKRADFIQPKDKKGNAEKGIKYEEEGTRWFNIARRATGERRDAALYLAYVYYRLSLSEFPNEASPYHNVGLMYYEMESYEAAQAFFEKAIELSPDLPCTHHMLGMIAKVWLKDLNRSSQNYLLGIQTKKTEEVSIKSKTACIQNYGANMMDNGRYAEAAYLAKWAMVSRTDNVQQTNIQNNFQNASEKISDAQFAEISAKQDGFSLEDMKRFALSKGKVDPSSTAKSSNNSVLPTGASKQVEENSTTIGNIPLSKIYEKMMVGAPKPELSGLKKALPEAPVDVRPALGGCYLIMHFPGMGKLGVYNVAQAKFDTYIPAPENAIYTAGGVNLLVYLPKDRVFQIYDMRTLQRSFSKPSRIIGEITDLEMSLFNSESALISYGENTDALATRRYGLLNLNTFQAMIFMGNELHNNCYRDNIHMRIDDQFEGFASWATSHSPSGFIYAQLGPRGLKKVNYEHNDCGSLVPDRHGQRVFSSRGKIFGLKGEVLKEFPSASLFPVRGSDYFFEVRKKDVTVREPLGYSEVAHFVLPFEFVTTGWNKDNLTSDRLVFGCAQLNRACFIDLKSLALYTFEIGLGGSVKEVRQALDGVARGSLWTSKLSFPAGTKVNVEDAPSGLKYDGSTTTLSWQVPAAQPAGSVTVLLSVTVPGKDEAYQRVVIPVR